MAWSPVREKQVRAAMVELRAKATRRFVQRGIPQAHSAEPAAARQKPAD
jgi:hypothetical protein